MADLDHSQATTGGQRQIADRPKGQGLTGCTIVTAPISGDMPLARFLSTNAAGVPNGFY
jgi:hypothetical protein